jgi:hypothetical protein
MNSCVSSFISFCALIRLMTPNGLAHRRERSVEPMLGSTKYILVNLVRTIISEVCLLLFSLFFEPYNDHLLAGETRL